MEDLVDMPLLVGEWSLATDNCAMWLNGFNDNLPGYPKVQCSMVPCAGPYMGYDQPGCPPDATMPRQGPFGTGERHPALTLCSRARVSFVERCPPHVYHSSIRSCSGVSGPDKGSCPVGVRWPFEDDAMTKLTLKQMHSFNSGHGWCAATPHRHTPSPHPIATTTPPSPPSIPGQVLLEFPHRVGTPLVVPRRFPQGLVPAKRLEPDHACTQRHLRPDLLRRSTWQQRGRTHMRPAHGVVGGE